MSRAEKFFLWNLLLAVIWCVGLVLCKLSEKDMGKGLTGAGLLAALFVFIAVPCGLASGVGALIIWREISWFGRAFAFALLSVSLVFISYAKGWIEQLPFGIRF